MALYDLVIKNGYVVDPGSELEGFFDIAVLDGRIEKIAENIDGNKAEEMVDAEKNCVFPGIIDLHTHMSGEFGGKYAHKMVAEVGVTTTLDMAGPIESAVGMAAKHGTGINVACLHMVRDQVTVPNNNPDAKAIDNFLDNALNLGAIGCKILGGHYPLTQEATQRVIEIANQRQVYVAFHAGTQKTGSNINGFLEAVDLAKGQALHIAHINSYCRGQVTNPRDEAEQAVKALIENPNITSESYVSPFNGTSGACTDGIPISNVTKTCLQTGGFEVSERGMEEAILKGWAHVNLPEGGCIVLKTGIEARNFWRSQDTDANVSFPVNPFDSRAYLAVARTADKTFVVDSISTDGGGIPRNAIVDIGMSLVRMKALSLRDFAVKTSFNPAYILGLRNKGHLGLGMDADITVVNQEKQKAVMSFVRGKLVMYNGMVVGKGGYFITTMQGERAIADAGLAPIVVDIANSGFYEKKK